MSNQSTTNQIIAWATGFLYGMIVGGIGMLSLFLSGYAKVTHAG